MILCFSAEENPQYAARAIAEQINEQVFSIRKVMNEDRYDLTVKAEENFGLVVPVYFHYLPAIVLKCSNRCSNFLPECDEYAFRMRGSIRMRW